MHELDWGRGVEITDVEGILLRETPPGPGRIDFHNAPRRQLVIHLRGGFEIAGGTGEKMICGPGDVLFGDDLTGEGHTATEVDGPRLQLVIYLPDDFDLSLLKDEKTAKATY